jgi:hypothetical protein
MDDPSLRKVVVHVTDISVPWRSVFRLTAKFMFAAAIIYSAFFFILLLITKIAVPYFRQDQPGRGNARAPIIEIGAAPRTVPTGWLTTRTQGLFIPSERRTPV